MNRKVFCLAFLFSVFFFTAGSQAQTTVDACQVISDADELYILDQNINANQTVCFTFQPNSDNSTLDCQGFEVYNFSRAVETVTSGANFPDNMIIQNCNFRDGDDFTGFSGRRNWTVQNSTFTRMANIWEENSGTWEDLVFKNNTLDSNTGTVFRLLGQRGHIIFQNVILNHTGTVFNYAGTGITSGKNDNVYDNYIQTDDGEYWTVNQASDTNITGVFNTTLQSGESIFNLTNMIGGNYWGLTNGSGFSDTCLDLDGNGFCDDKFVILELTNHEHNATDFLPLSLNFTEPTPPAPTPPITGLVTGAPATVVGIIAILIAIGGIIGGALFILQKGVKTETVVIGFVIVLVSVIFASAVSGLI